MSAPPTASSGSPAVPSASLGLPRLHLRTTDSTNTRARELAAAGAPHGTLVTAAEQSAGRGRQGRTWSAPAGQALLCSLVIRRPGPLLSLTAGVAVAEVAGDDARVKWPNDVLVDGRKVAGILVEGRPQEGWVVLGIGVNVALRLEDMPAQLRESAGTLGLGAAEIEPTLARLVGSLSTWLERSDDEILAAFADRDALRGQMVTWSEGRGRAGGVDDRGRLLVSTEDGREHALWAGEVHLTTG
ncbi:MAG TPA: biotin--[acetyl-CoA-carboxylase] ligase [Solirubrobacteraceae bacterium]|nr:biotin--[acetyl-CoA-carboxylase] ligase [Solirubrobacteraceae bacterium]